MTDDIVTRLRKHHEWFGNGWQPTSVWEDAANEIEQLRKDVQFQARVISRHYEQFASSRKEIERLRALLAGIHKAVTDEGRSPAYHQQVMRRHRKEWSVLWQAIDKAMKGFTNG